MSLVDLTHWGRDKWPPFRWRIFQMHFLNENVWISIIISLNYLPTYSINNIVAVVQIMAWCWPDGKPLSRTIMVSLLTQICVTRSQWVNSLGPSDAIWRWRSWSKLVQVMACCLAAPSHYLNQCWLITSKVLWHSSKDMVIRNMEIPISEARWKITFSKSL